MRKWINIVEAVILLAMLVFVVGFNKYYYKQNYIQTNWVSVDKVWDDTNLENLDINKINMVELTYENPVVRDGVDGRKIDKNEIIEIINNNNFIRNGTIHFVEARIDEVFEYLNETKTRKVHKLEARSQSIKANVGDLLFIIDTKSGNDNLQGDCTYINDNGILTRFKIFLVVSKGKSIINFINDNKTIKNQQITVKID